MQRQRRWGLAAATAVLTACGGNGGGPVAPPRVPTHTVTVVIFYDTNGNGLRDANEGVRLPNVLVAVGGPSARTDSAGRAAVALVPEGQHTVTVGADTLPPYYTVNPLPLTVPSAQEIVLGARLPVGPRVIPNKYMAFGDSLSFGTYESNLESLLRAHFGDAVVVDEGVSGTRSQAGAARIADALDYARPAVTLILYGVNDWNELACKDDRFPCYTIDSLRRMVRDVQAAGSLAFLATLPPVNVGFSEQAPPERNEWVTRLNDLIRKVAREENAVLVDVHKAFLAAPNLKALFVDYVHPSAQGQSVMAQEFFEAITKRQAAATGFRFLPFTIR